MRRFLITTIVATSFGLPVVIAACGDDGGTVDADPFDTYQLCFDEHHTTEGLTTKEAIVVCCIDHPIAGVKLVCKDTQADCEAYLQAQLTDATTDAEITDGCADYLVQKSM